MKNIGFSIKNMDTSTDPFENFYLYSAGLWIKKHPLPKTRARLTSFDELSEVNLYTLKGIIESCKTGKYKGINAKLINDFYTSFMDTHTIEKRKFDSIKELFKRIDSIKNRKGLIETISYLNSIGISPFVSISSNIDDKNSEVYALYLSQGGINLPEKSYYLSEKFSKLRELYIKHIQEMFKLYGMESKEALKIANIIMKIETYIAKSSRNSADLRDDIKNYHKYSSGKLNKDYPNFMFDTLFKELGIKKLDYAIVGQPEFLSKIDSLISTEKIDNLKLYMKWCSLTYLGGLLHKAVYDEHFNFYGKALMGQMSPQPRWKRAIRFIDGTIDEALGSFYIKENFTEYDMKRAKVLIEDIKRSFRNRLSNIDWMEEKTKKMALEKFDSINTKIGHPRKFRDYSKIKSSPNDLIGNLFKANKFEFDRDMSRIGKKTDKNEWVMSAYEVNAYYDPSLNEIVIPAGILQPPFFDSKKDDAINYGAIGGVIGHELTHGYDDQGSKYDKYGNLNDWWTKKDRANFKSKAKNIVKLYGSLSIIDGINVNGELTLGENIADLGGIHIAYDALMKRVSETGKNKLIDGFTQEQRFYISWSQLWKCNISEQAEKMLAMVDPHSPAMYRAKVPVETHEEFAKTFKSKSKLKQPKDKYKRVNLW